MKQEIFFKDLGLRSYKESWDLQEVLLKQNVEIKSTANRDPSSVNSHLSTVNHLLFVEHPPVYTLGKSGHVENVLLNEEGLKAIGIEFFHINRGGDITFHGPQQLVGYPIIDLDKFKTDLGWYLRS